MALNDLLKEQKQFLEGQPVLTARDYLISVSAVSEAKRVPESPPKAAAESSPLAQGEQSMQSADDGSVAPMQGYGYLAHPATNDYLHVTDVLRLALQVLRTNSNQHFSLSEEQLGLARQIGDFGREQPTTTVPS